MRHLQQALELTGGADARHIRDLTATASRHPIAKIQHIGPAGGCQGRAVFAIVEVFFVVDLFEPVAQEHSSRLSTAGMARPVAQVVDVAAKFMQAANRFAAQHTAQRCGKERFKQADAVAAGKRAELLQGLMPNPAFGHGDRPQKRRVIVRVEPQTQPAT